MKEYLRDYGKSIVIGLVISISIILLTVFVSFITGHSQVSFVLETVVSALCIVGALGLFLSAAFIMRKKPVISKEHSNGWRKHFRKINIVTLFIIVSTTLLLIAGGVDYLRY